MPLNRIYYFLDRKILPGFKLPRKAKVIDIGSGDKPFWRANVFIDKLDLKDLHRHTDTPPVTTLGNFVDGDITKTPFKNKAFDYSFCAHLLEHVERPDLAINEIVRISKRGYIEVPNGIIEFISPFYSHLWFILLSNKKLVFVRKSKTMHKHLLNNALHHKNLIGKIDEPFIRIYWKNKIDFEIVDNLKTNEKYFPPNKTPKNDKNMLSMKVGNVIYLIIIKMLRKVSGINSNLKLEKTLKK